MTLALIFVADAAHVAPWADATVDIAAEDWWTPPELHSGTGSVSSTATLTSSGQKGGLGAGSVLSSTGTATSAGQKGGQGSGLIEGTGSFAGSGEAEEYNFSGAGSFSSAGTLTSAGQKGGQGSGAAAGTGSLSSVGQKGGQGTGSVAVSSDVPDATGQIGAVGAGVASSLGVLSSAGLAERLGTGLGEAFAVVAVTGGGARSGPGIMFGAASLVADGRKTLAGTANVAILSDVLSGGFKDGWGTAFLYAGSGSTAAAGESGRIGTGAALVTVTLSVTGGRAYMGPALPLVVTTSLASLGFKGGQGLAVIVVLPRIGQVPHVENTRIDVLTPKSEAGVLTALSKMEVV